MKKIDIHAHVMKTKRMNRMGSNSTFVTPEELYKMHERLGVDKAVILPSVHVECNYGTQSCEEVLEIVEAYPERYYWFCNIDPRMGTNKPDIDISYALDYYRELGAKGVGELCCNLYFDDPYVENLFYHCQKCNMPVLFHIGTQIGGCYGLVDEIGLHRLEKELKKFPDLMFIGHSQAFWSEISADVTNENRGLFPKGKVIPGRVVELMRKYKNLYADISATSGFTAMTRDPVFGYGFIEEFQDRVYFGTDICAPENDYRLSFWLDDAVNDGKISTAAYERVCRGNALKILEG